MHPHPPARVATMTAFRRSELSCPEARAAIAARLDRALPAGDADRLAAHLESCADCAGATDAERRYRVAMARHGRATAAPTALRWRVARLLRRR